MASKENSPPSINTEALPQGTAPYPLFSAEFIDSSVALWRIYGSDIILSQDTVKEMADNLSGFFEILKSWDEKEANGTKKD